MFQLHPKDKTVFTRYIHGGRHPGGGNSENVGIGLQKAWHFMQRWGTKVHKEIRRLKCSVEVVSLFLV